MKKFMKVMLIIAAVFASVGIGLTVGGTVMGARMGDADVVQEVEKHFRNLFGIAHHVETVEVEVLEDEEDISHAEEAEEEPEHTKKVKEMETVQKNNTDSRAYRFSEMDNLEIELKYDELILTEHTGTELLVEVNNDSEGNVKVQEDGNTLEITSSRKLAVNRQVKISFPKDKKFHEIELAVGAGTVEIQSSLTADKLDVNMGAGVFENYGTITVSEADLEVGTGSLTITGLSAQEIDGECGIGEMRLEINGREEAYNYSLECGIGNIQLGSKDYSGLGREKIITNPGAKGTISLECGIGEIGVSFSK